jgi:hypothetical protein
MSSGMAAMGDRVGSDERHIPAVALSMNDDGLKAMAFFDE